MPLDSLFALLGIVLVSAWTPGPNNAMLSASGASFGYRASVPHILGVALGFPLMLFVCAMGLGQVVAEGAWLREAMRWVGVALLIWVAFKIATAPLPGRAAGTTTRKPFTFLQAAAFQWVNPKAWAMALGIVAQFVTGAAPLKTGLICAGVAAIGGLTSANGWAGFGVLMMRWLRTERRFRAFSLIMASILMAGVLALVLTDI